MAMLSKVLKNQSSPSVDIEVSEAGVTISGGQAYTIDPINYLYWSTPEAIAELTPFINSGDIVVNDGTNDLSASEGLRFLEYADRPTVTLNGSKITDFAKIIDMQGDVNVLDAGDGESTIIIGETGSAVGKLYTIEAFSLGNTFNKWLNVEHPSNSSDTVPFVMPGSGRCIAMTYINENDSSEIDIEVYKNGTLVYTWPIRNKRYAYNVLNAGLFNISQGDRISIFAKRATGTDPKDLSLNISFTITSFADGEGGQETGV
jgi:hypothetical protein